MKLLISVILVFVLIALASPGSIGGDSDQPSEGPKAGKFFGKKRSKVFSPDPSAYQPISEEEAVKSGKPDSDNEYFGSTQGDIQKRRIGDDN